MFGYRVRTCVLKMKRSNATVRKSLSQTDTYLSGLPHDIWTNHIFQYCYDIKVLFKSVTVSKTWKILVFRSIRVIGFSGSGAYKALTKSYLQQMTCVEYGLFYQWVSSCNRIVPGLASLGNMRWFAVV